ncbi:hypothetical protein [Geminicoccus roseus]|uniref:hypothetical protein n=1 Tax=Geminicoccus roseus TaxID=404900 RepID=UPI0012FC1245|nr:hypothetical protein [Geminicoccus roseus]
MVRSGDGSDLVLRFDRPLLGEADRISMVLGRSILSATVEGDILRLRLRHRVQTEIRRVSLHQAVVSFREAAQAPDPQAAATITAPLALPALLAEDPLDSSPLPSGEPFAPAASPAEAGSSPSSSGQTEPLEQHLLSAPDLDERAPPLRPAVLRIGATRATPDHVAVDYAWDQVVPAAAFLRDHQVWMVFAAATAKLAADPFALARSLDGMVLDAERQVEPDRLIFRLALAPGVRPAFAPAPGGNATWRLSLERSGNIEPEEATAAVPTSLGPDGTLHFNLPGPVLEVADRRAGDRLLVVPAVPDAAQPLGAGGYPELDLLPTLAGLVLRPLRPDVLVDTADGAVRVRRSARQPMAVDETQPGSRAASPAGLDFRSLGGAAGLAERRRAEAELARAPADPAARSRLVRVLLGAGLVTEAKVALDQAGAAAPTLIPLAAAAAALAEPRDVSPERFTGLASADAAEGALWRAYLHSQRGAWPQAAAAFAASGDTLFHYPPALRRILGEAVVRALTQSGDGNAALAIIDRLMPAATNPEEQAGWKLLQAEALAKENALPAARRRLEEAASLGDDATALQAEGGMLDLALLEGSIDAAGAQAILTAMAPAWEGSHVQPDMERRLAQVAAAAGDWATALAAADRAAALPAPAAPADPAEPATLLAQALEASDLNMYERLDLLQDRSLDELRSPDLIEGLKALARSLGEHGHLATAQALRAALSWLPELAAESPSTPAGPAEDRKSTLSPATLELLQVLETADLGRADDVESIQRALSALAEGG